MERFHNLNMYLFGAAKSGIQRIYCLVTISKQSPIREPFSNCKLLIFFGNVMKFDRFMVIPDMLKNAPMFKRLDARIKVLYSQCV